MGLILKFSSHTIVVTSPMPLRCCLFIAAYNQCASGCRIALPEHVPFYDCCIAFRLRSYRYVSSSRLYPSGSSPATICFVPRCLSSSGGPSRRCRDQPGRLALSSHWGYQSPLGAGGHAPLSSQSTYFTETQHSC